MWHLIARQAINRGIFLYSKGTTPNHQRSKQKSIDTIPQSKDTSQKHKIPFLANTDLIGHDTAIIGRDTARFSVCKASKLKKMATVWQNSRAIVITFLYVRATESKHNKVFTQDEERIRNAFPPKIIH